MYNVHCSFVCIKFSKGPFHKSNKENVLIISFYAQEVLRCNYRDIFFISIYEKKKT